MRARLSALALVAATCAPLLPAAAQAAPVAEEKIPERPASFLSGKWTSMGNEITIMANRAAGPASRIMIELPHMLQKSGTARFTLAHKSGNLWVGQDDHHATLTFELKSDNFAELTMTGDKPDHHFEMPFSRF
ncbi:hypothetical protein GOB87_08795 [Acetobacter estunensis]|uniref:TIGR03067 domain-containing protein n=1 Tax=Acetobacter estunensis TaxID=104097 RepID=A0A967EHR6_9PROT|nr:hypothetical protein [Acetobacter estunensis]NHO54052.1 hypothetical protein [Acetobacter estunensis]